MMTGISTPSAKPSPPPSSYRAVKPLSVLLITLFVALHLAGCSNQQTAICLPGEEAQFHDMLYFGSDGDSGRVTGKDWAHFLRAIITPRFPDGLTVIDGAGQWRSETGEIIRESSYILSVVHAANTTKETAISEIIQAYKKEFDQKSVLRVRNLVCVSFR